MGYLLDKIIDDIGIRDIVIFGAGVRGRSILNLMDLNWRSGVLFFVDNNWKEYGKCEGYDVCPPESMRGKHVFIIVSPLYGDKEIFMQLDEMGFRKNIDYINYSSFLYAYLEENREDETRGKLYESSFVPIVHLPWVEDNLFIEVYKFVNKYALSDVAKLNYIWRMVGEACKLRKGVFLEIGLWRSGSVCMIAKKVEVENNSGDVYLCYTSADIAKYSDKDDYYNGGEHADIDVSTVEEMFDEMNLKNVKIIRFSPPENACEELTGKEIAFAHIDVDVYMSARFIIDYIWPMIMPGGIVVFDDYGAYNIKDQKKYVDEMKSMSDRIFIANLIGQCILVKK